MGKNKEKLESDKLFDVSHQFLVHAFKEKQREQETNLSNASRKGLAEKAQSVLDSFEKKLLSNVTKRFHMSMADNLVGIYKNISNGKLTGYSSKLAVSKYFHRHSDLFPNDEFKETEVQFTYAPTKRDLSEGGGPVNEGYQAYADSSGISQKTLFNYQKKLKNGELGSGLKDLAIFGNEKNQCLFEVLTKVVKLSNENAQLLVAINELLQSENSQ